MARRLLRTGVCPRLNIEYPVFLAGMGGVCGPTLVAAVSNAGGFGVLGGSGLFPDELDRMIQATRQLTDKPFGVDLLLPEDLPSERAIATARAEIPQKYRDFVEKLRQEIGVPPAKAITGRRKLSDELVRQQVDIILGNKVPLLALGLGTPSWVLEKAHKAGTLVTGLVGNVRTARRLAERGVDIIVAQGYEAGGHTGRIGTLALVPQVVDAVSPIPVLAGGGIGDGRGLAAALALGAVGVWVGTAFIATHEAFADFLNTSYTNQVTVDNWKRRILEATEEDTHVTKIYTGKTARQIKNKLIELWEKSGMPALPMPLQFDLMNPLEAAIMEAGKTDYMSGFAGQISGMIQEIKPAAQLVREIVDGATRVLEKLAPVEAAS